MKSSGLVAFTLLFVGVAPAVAEVVSETQPLLAISEPIVNGVLTSALPSVAALVRTDMGDPFAFCTGTLVGCRTVLTAAHCFCGTDTPGSACQPSAAGKFAFFQHSGIYPIESVSVDPNYIFAQGSDLAIVRLAAPVGGVEPTPINTIARPAPGSLGLISGFGRVGGTNPLTGIKRAGAVATSTCLAVPGAGNLCWDFLLPVGPPGSDSSTCQGDSGGPLFTDFGTGAVAAGVTSGGVIGDCLAPNLLWDTDVFVDRLWIEGAAGADLGTTNCGGLPAAGSPGAPFLFASGALSAANPGDAYSFEVPSGTQLLWLTSNGENAGDFDLYVKRGSVPTTTSFDCGSEFAGQFEACGVASPAPGTWNLLINRFSGAGLYQVTATTFLGGSTGGPCVQDAHTLCLQNNRFRVRVDFRAPGEISRPANAIPFTQRAGMFWFFNENNIEMLIKIQNACVDPFNRYWVFFAATTNVEFEVVVEDTAHPGVERHYTNPQGVAALPVQDTGAFATCP